MICDTYILVFPPALFYNSFEHFLFKEDTEFSSSYFDLKGYHVLFSVSHLVLTCLTYQ